MCVSDPYAGGGDPSAQARPNRSGCAGRDRLCRRLPVRLIGAPVWDEWHCKRSEAPFITEGEEGEGCLPLDGGSEFLVRGRIWDPLGNRPYFCESRRGWTVIHRGDDEECLRDGINLPEGWLVGPVQRQP